MTYESQYSDAVLADMESVYGEGFLSPGGAVELRDLLDGLDVEGREVLDLGCGLGGASLALARDFGAARVTGIDLEAASIARAAATVEAAGLSDRVAVQLVAPGPLPFPDAHFDLVLTKDVICHMPDKAPVFAEAFRVLRPGGAFATADWIKGHEGPGSADYEDWAARLLVSGLKFHFSPLETYLDGLKAAGFEAIEARDHSAWSERDARRQLAQTEGPAREVLRERLGVAGYENRIALLRARAGALAKGGLMHGHLQSRRPA